MAPICPVRRRAPQARRRGRPDLSEVLVERDHHLVVEVPASLRETLVLDVQPGHPRFSYSRTVRVTLLDLPRFRGEVRAWDQGIWSDGILSSSLVPFSGFVDTRTFAFKESATAKTRAPYTPSAARWSSWCTPAARRMS
jgi:hypothetical protein